MDVNFENQFKEYLKNKRKINQGWELTTPIILGSTIAFLFPISISLYFNLWNYVVYFGKVMILTVFVTMLFGVIAKIFTKPDNDLIDFIGILLFLNGTTSPSLYFISSFIYGIIFIVFDGFYFLTYLIPSIILSIFILLEYLGKEKMDNILNEIKNNLNRLNEITREVKQELSNEIKKEENKTN